MKCKLIVITIFIYFSNGDKVIKSMKAVEGTKHKFSTANKPFGVKTTSTTTELPYIPDEKHDNNTLIYKTTNVMKVPDKIDIPIKKKIVSKMIKPSLIQEWAEDISAKLRDVERQVVRRDFLLKNFADIKIETRDGSAIVDKVAAALEDLLQRRAEAAEAIGRAAEELASKGPTSIPAPSDYIFDNSINLGELKKVPKKPDSEWEIVNNCSSSRRVMLKNLSHFGRGAEVELDITSVKVASEVFDCDPRILQHMYWSEELLHTFRHNYAQDAMTDFQYFCSAKGFLRHYPAASWESMFQLKLGSDDDEDEGPADVYDCRLRPWYVAATGAPRDILILFDNSGSMVNSTNKVHALKFTQTLLNALSDDDQVNVLRMRYYTQSPIYCFNDMLVPANYVNTAAIMATLTALRFNNVSRIAEALYVSVGLLKQQQLRTDRPKSCQQAIIVVSDTIEENFTDIMRDLNPEGDIRLFVVWLHDVWGLRDRSRLYGESLSCTSDGYFSELVTDYDVTEQVMQILRVLERPLVHQRKHRPRVFSDLYAHVEDPRRSEFYWRQKENMEQAYRYKQLRRNKAWFLSAEQSYKDYMHQQSLDIYGHYYEGEDLKYKYQISVSVPVFDHTTIENITIVLAEEKQRNSTRTYPVNRLLGVAGVDIPIDHLKLMLPYYQLGAGGSLFIIDHRGNIVLHDNIKPTFDGDILKPGYRTVDILDLEQPGIDLPPRNYSAEWLEFRNAVVIQHSKGSRVMYSKYIFEHGMRAILEHREYHWKRVQNHYTVVVVLPKYNKRHAVPDGSFTMELASKANQSFSSELSVHPDWLYCKHVDQQFDEPEFEVRHFVRRRSEERDFKMQNLYHRFSPFQPTIFEKTYLCNEELMARLCKEAIATEQWAEEHEDPDLGRECRACELGSVTAFFASESGLTRWQQYHMASAHADPPAGSEWPRGPSEVWYKRAAASPDTLVIHAPVTPIRKMRYSDAKPPSFTIRDTWLTAARTLGYGTKGMIGVAGYHFHPLHLEDILRLTTNRPCADEDDCEPRCDGEDWTCVLIDEGGWIVAGHPRDEDSVTAEDPAREHLARIHPHAMRILLEAQVFKLHWIHDYQGVCFPPEFEDIFESATKMIPSIIKSIWRTVSVVLFVTKEIITLIALISSGGLVSADTEFEKEKRRRRLWKDYQREKYERLFDERILVNRTRFTACDRSRALYELQRTPKALATLKQPANNCTWPLVGVVVPETNLMLLAIFNLCPYSGRPVPDPLINEPVDMRTSLGADEWGEQLSAARLACWRNKVPLPVRAPHTACFPHNYSQEVGYRQCGPWLPDPEVEESHSSVNCLNRFLLLTIFSFYCIVIVNS